MLRLSHKVHYNIFSIHIIYIYHNYTKRKPSYEKVVKFLWLKGIQSYKLRRSYQISNFISNRITWNVKTWLFKVLHIRILKVWKTSFFSNLSAIIYRFFRWKLKWIILNQYTTYTEIRTYFTLHFERLE